MSYGEDRGCPLDGQAPSRFPSFGLRRSQPVKTSSSWI